MKKRILSLGMALVLCLGLTAPALAAAQTFTDVPASYWAYDAIERAYAGGIVNGTSYDQATGARTYSPENSLTLAHFVVMLTRAFYGTEVERSSATGAWYAKNLAAAKAHGLLDGLGAYSMDATATRYQMASIMAAIMEDKGAVMPSDAELAKAQGQIGDWADIPQQYRDAVAAVFALGIIQGTDSKGTFAGEATVKRSHAAVIYGRLADAIEALSGTEQGQTPAKEYTMSLGVMHREIEVGDYTNAQCLFEPYHNDITVKFTSSNTSVATVEAYCTDGAHVYGKSAGTAVITATAPNGETDSVTVTVVGGSSDKPGNNVSTGDYGDVKLEIIDNINVYRKEDGVAALTANDELMKAAQIRAEECAAMNSMNNHYRPDGSYWGTVLTEIGYPYTARGEILVAPSGTPGSVDRNLSDISAQAWRNSAGHNKVMVDSKYNEVGVGIAKAGNNTYYVCAIMGSQE